MYVYSGIRKVFLNLVSQVVSDSIWNLRITAVKQFMFGLELLTYLSNFIYYLTYTKDGAHCLVSKNWCLWNKNSISLALYVFRSVCKIAKSDFSFVISVCLSVYPHGKTRLSLDGFSLNLIFEYFSKICEKNSSFIKIWQE